jgi:DNA segregation ATPase FtsK/SpoIIIE-like protein
MPATPDVTFNNDTDLDELYDEAVKFVTESKKSSIADVQKKFLIGYIRVSKIDSLDIFPRCLTGYKQGLI